MATAPEGPAFGSREPPPPSWDGSEPGLELPVFERNMRLWEYESELDPKKRGARLLRNLSGSARAVADNLDFEKIACEDGVKNILQELKSHFAPHLEVSLPRAFERAVYGKPRSHKETMQEYLIRCERSFHLLEKEACKLPDVAAGYVVYRQASLTEAQEIQFTTWSGGKFDIKTVTSCLRKLEKVIPEHKLKSSTAFVHEHGEDDGVEGDNDVYLEDASDDEQYVYLEELDEGQIYDESDVQVALATYQEIRKAINSQVKSRQFYGGKKGDGRGSGHQKGYFKGKRKIKIEELKLRTRCGRCGLVGHWAKECTNPPDARGRQNLAASSKSSSPPSTSSAGRTQSGTASQQSWYVSSGAMCHSDELGNMFYFLRCGGKHQSLDPQENEGTAVQQVEDVIWGHQELKGCSDLAFCNGATSATSILPQQSSWPNFFFTGLTTSPLVAVVDTAAQDGLIGAAALQRLKEQLTERGLQVVWTTKQARAQGVGGQAKVLGIVAIPLGIGGSSGVLETTVVEGEVPLLLPIKMLRQLKAVIDLNAEHVHLAVLQKTIPLCFLPSGHVAIDVFDFGEHGFQFPNGLQTQEFNESDFRIPMDQEAMDVSAPEEARVVNPKRAVKHWRILLDKVKQVQDLIGQEELVHSWLPAAPISVSASPVSSEQLAEHIKSATPLEPLKSKVAARIAAAECKHPKESLTLGANQHGAWVTCMECLSRWRAPSEWRQQKKPASTAAAAKSKAASSKKSTASSAEERFDATKMESEMVEELNRQKHALEVKYMTEKELDMNRLRKELMDEMLKQSHTQTVAMSQLTSEVRQQSRYLKVKELMMSEYASMALGQNYTETKGYHDGEMQAYAERILELREEQQQMTEVQQEMADFQRSSSQSRGVRKDAQKTKAATPTMPRRHGFD
eukprot:s783_g13.t1